MENEKQKIEINVIVPVGFKIAEIYQGDVTTHIFDDKSGMVVNCLLNIVPNTTNDQREELVTEQEKKELEAFKKWWDKTDHPVSYYEGIEKAEDAWLARARLEAGDTLEDLIAQAKADKAAYPQVWFYGWEAMYSECMGLDGINREKWGQCIMPPQSDNPRYYRRHPLADIIMQCEQDKRDYPDFWFKLWQFSDPLIDKPVWHNLEWENKPIFDAFWLYRQHPHRDLIIQWHGCSDADKLRWQSKARGSQWFDSDNPEWIDSNEYRLRPRTCKITLQNGTVFEYPEPIKLCADNTETYLVHVDSGEIYTNIFNNNCGQDLMWLSLNLLHDNEQAAQQHLLVLQAINAQQAV